MKIKIKIYKVQRLCWKIYGRGIGTEYKFYPCMYLKYEIVKG